MVRAKFRVYSISRNPDGGGSVALSAVYGNGDPEHENTKFFQSTPSGNITMATVNAAALEQFKQGQECYVDFTPIEPAEAAPAEDDGN